MAKSRPSFNAAEDIDIRMTRPGVTAPVTTAAPAQTENEIEASRIHPSPYNEGLDMSRVEEYAESMKEVGLISPIVVYDMGDGTYQILTGHQRFQAWCKVLRHKTIKAFVRPYETDPVKRFIAHTEANTLSRDRNLKFWLSRIDVSRRVLRETGFVGTKEEEDQKISEMIGLSRAQIYRYDSFKKLIPELQDLEAKRWLSASTLYIAVTLDPEQQLEVARRVNETYSSFNQVAARQSTDAEISRQEFKHIVDAVKSGTKPPKKRPGYADKIGSATLSYIKAIGNPKTEEERSATLEEIQKAKEALTELEKKLRK